MHAMDKIQILEDTKDSSSAKILTLSYIWRKRWTSCSRESDFGTAPMCESWVVSQLENLSLSTVTYPVEEENEVAM